MSDPDFIDPGQLRPGPIRHESLSPELVSTIGAVFGVIGPYLDTTLEQFEVTFMRDSEPESEVALWCCIAKTWLAYHEDFLGNEVLPDKEERRLLAALIGISMGIEGVSKLKVPPEVGKRLLQCYNGLRQK